MGRLVGRLAEYSQALAAGRGLETEFFSSENAVFILRRTLCKRLGYKPAQGWLNRQFTPIIQRDYVYLAQRLRGKAEVQGALRVNGWYTNNLHLNVARE